MKNRIDITSNLKNISELHYYLKTKKLLIRLGYLMKKSLKNI